MSRDDRNEEIQTGQPHDGGRREGGAAAPANPRLLRRPSHRTPADRIGLLVGAALGAAAGLAIASYCSPINLAYHEGPALSAGMRLDGLPADAICAIVGASLLANIGWAVGFVIGFRRRAHAATDGENA